MTDIELLTSARDHSKLASEQLDAVFSGDLSQITAARDNLRTALAAAESLERRARGVPAPKVGE